MRPGADSAGIRSHRFVHALLFGLAYFAGSEIGYSLSLGPSVGGTFWPPAGISLAVFLAAPSRNWPALLVAAFAGNYLSDLLHGQPLSVSIGYAIANVGEAVIGALILRRLLRAPITFTRVVDMLALAAVVVGVAAPFAASIGALTAEGGLDRTPGFTAGWITWWVGDSVGALVLTPFVFRVITDWRRAKDAKARTWVEAAAFAAVVWSVTHFIFTAPPTSTSMPFLVFPVLLWGSLRLGPIGVGGALCLVVLLTAHDTANGQGPFAAQHMSYGDRLVALQTYVGVMALSFHGLALLWEERTRAAAALRLAHSGLEARYHRIVEQSPLAILTIRRDAPAREVNPAWERLWAADGAAEGGTGRRGREDPAIEPVVERAFAGEVVELPEREIAIFGSGDASSRRVRGVAYPIKDDAGGVAEVVLIARDITAEVRAQQQLVEANQALREREEALSLAVQQMADAQAHRERLLEAERAARSEAERASTLKDQFLATLSHELRTPLNAIVGWTHILRSRITDAALVPAVETIDRNARAQAKLIDDLLDMTSIIAGKVNLTLTAVALGDVVSTAAEALRPLADAKGVTLAIDLRGADTRPVPGDAARLQQVVANLLGNSLKFTPEGGRIDARVSVGRDTARIEVRDTGQGIPAEFLPSVFERFRQADGSITRRHGGLGLGLSIAHHIVDLHGGTITAHSDGPGRGSVFTVTLPAEEAEPAAVSVETTPPLADVPAGLRVLVVDDEEDARELLRRLLLDHGCEVACAASAAEALAALTTSAHDVLLSDIGMPGTDGYELLRRLREAGRAPLRSVALTAFARREDRERALAAGFDEHLAKPIDPHRLFQVLSGSLPTQVLRP